MRAPCRPERRVPAGDPWQGLADERRGDRGRPHGRLLVDGGEGEGEGIAGSPVHAQLDAARVDAVEVQALLADAAGWERPEEREGAWALRQGHVRDGVLEAG